MHSSDVSFVLFLIELAIDVHVFVGHALPRSAHDTHLQAFLLERAAPILERWAREGEAANDLASTAVAHTYRALLFSGFPDEQNDVTRRCLGSAAYVRNWHAFGADIGDAASAGDARSRLLRVLQAQGTIDTGRMRRDNDAAIDAYIEQQQSSDGAAERPLYLHVGGEVIRAPTLRRAAADAKRPPARVPEWRLMDAAAAPSARHCGAAGAARGAR